MGDGWIIFLFMGVLVAIGAAVAWHYQRARTEAMGRLADELGWMFQPHGVSTDSSGDFLSSLLGLITSESDMRYRAFGVFSQGRDRRAYNTLQGSLLLPAPGGPRPCPAVAGDFRYTTGSGKNKSTHHFSYLIVELPCGPVPETIIRPEGFFDQVAGFVGFDDIDFESAEFSDAFHVKGADKRFAYDLCDPRMMQFLLATRPQGLELDRFHLCISTGQKRWPVETFKQNIAWVGHFIDHWPRHLVDRLAPRQRASAQPSSTGAHAL